MISTLSLRNDWGPFRHDPLSPMTGPAPSFRKQGDFPSCHIGEEIIFPVIPKGIFQAKKPLFYPRFQSPTFCPSFYPTYCPTFSFVAVTKLESPWQSTSAYFFEILTSCPISLPVNRFENCQNRKHCRPLAANTLYQRVIKLIRQLYILKFHIILIHIKHPF